MKKWLTKMLSDVHGQASSKRTVTLVAAALCFVAFVANLFFALPLEEFVYNGMLYLVAAGLGFSAVEKFSIAKKPVEEAEKTDEA